MDLEIMDETCDIAFERVWRYRQRMSSMYKQNVCEQIFVEGKLILRVADYVRRNIAAPSKFAPNLEGPYVVKETHGSGYYRLSSKDESAIMDPINGKWFKLYHA